MRGRLGQGLIVVMCAAMVLSVGCGRKTKKMGSGTMGSEVLTPLTLGAEGGEAMGPRMEGGTPVTDVKFENVLFDYDRFEIKDTETTKIEAVAEFMKKNPDVTLVAEGHCDERGSNEYNMALGEHRSLAVRAYLIGLGIAGERIQTKSFGEERPLDPGHSESAWRVNRRVEFALFR